MGVTLPVTRTIPHPDRLRGFLERGALIAGGFPLWAAGYSPKYGDIDVYPLRWDMFNQFAAELRSAGKWTGETRSSFSFMVDMMPYSLVFPFDSEYKTADQILNHTDMTATACSLIWEDNQFKIKAVYPDDLKNKVSRILIDHDWTAYRAESYSARGFTILNEDGTPYKLPNVLPSTDWKWW